MSKKFILFDFDGVIADSFYPALKVAQKICPHLSEEDYRKMFEDNIHTSVEKHNQTKNLHTNECLLDAEWFDLYLPVMKEEATLFPTIEEVISILEKEYVLVIISSTLTFPIEEFLEEHNLRSHFDWVMGSDVHKSKVEKIKMVFDKYKIQSQDCLFITDTLGDVQEARKMEVDSIGVLWGFNREPALKNGAPFALATEPSHLPTLVSQYFTR